MTDAELDAMERSARIAAHANGHAQSVLRLVAELRRVRGKAKEHSCRGCGDPCTDEHDVHGALFCPDCYENGPKFMRQCAETTKRGLPCVRRVCELDRTMCSLHANRRDRRAREMR